MRHSLNLVSSTKIVKAFCILFTVSCGEKPSLIDTKETSLTKDSIIYSLAPKAMQTLDTLIGSRNVKYLYLITNHSENEFTFSFSLVEETDSDNRINYLLEHGTRYLRTTSKTIPLVLDADDLFLASPEKNRGIVISHKPAAWIVVNAQGKLISFHSEDYKLE